MNPTTPSRVVGASTLGGAFGVLVVMFMPESWYVFTAETGAAATGAFGIIFTFMLRYLPPPKNGIGGPAAGGGTSNVVRALPLLFLLALGGCAASAGLTPEERANLTPAARVFEVQSEFNILLRAAGAYRRQPECTEVVVVACHDKEALATIQAFASETNAIIASAKVAIAGGNEDAATLAALSRTALARMSAYMIAKGAKQ